MSSEKVRRGTEPKIIPGLERADEEKYLAETIVVAERNLEQAQESVKKLSEDLEDLREAYTATDKEGRVLWNNAKAQYKDAVSSIARYEKARKKPYFGRIDFLDEREASRNGKISQEECYYIGRVGIARTATEPAVIDWRTPVASVYYENALGHGQYTVSSEGTFSIDLKRKRSYEIENDQLKDFYDLDVVANDELLTKYLSKNKTEVLGEIIATIQKEQNRIIRRSPRTNLIVQGVAGSGKTTVAMHRISYILYNYENEFRPEDFYIIGSNKILLNYITSVLPELDVYGVRQMTMEQLFIRLLYEDWDERKYTFHTLDKNNARNGVKGSQKWFEDLEAFCWQYEDENVSREPVYLDKTGELLLESSRIDSYLKENPTVSMQSKRLMLNEILYSRYENVILGKHISFTPEEKKILEKKYRYYFGKDEWKGSIYDIYHTFLLTQRAKGLEIDIPDTSFDVYDLAALAYLYKRIKEIDPICEATHVVIDEAQDFGMMAYAALHFCMRGCTYTIMGDTSQNIHFEYGLNDWNELKKLILTGLHDKFCLLRKSYRNTVEISEFATEILRHGDFSIYPVEPIIRHGNPVQVKNIDTSDSDKKIFASEDGLDVQPLIDEAVQIIRGWQNQGYETIAVVCRDMEEAQRVSARLGKQMEIKDLDPEMTEFGSGVMVLPVAYTKGLEFDAVLVFHPTEKKYPADNGHVKMLYVTATRALHELTILHDGNLTPLLAKKAPKGKHLAELLAEEAEEEEEIVPKFTEKEIIERNKKYGRLEMAERSYIGPERIKPSAAQMVKKESVSEQASKHQPQAGTEDHPIKINTSPARFAKKKPAENDGRPVNASVYQYGEIPDNRILTVRGHSKPNTAVRWVKKSKTSVEVTSSYGVLTLTPITETCIRVSFVKGQLNRLQETYWKPKPETGFKWTAKESPSVLEVATKKLIVHIEKRDGAIRFLSPDRKLLLSEKASEPRLAEGKETWNFFEFDKKEQLKSKGILATDLSDLQLKTRYISFGAKPLRMPLLLSSKGYAMAVASEKTVMFCGIPMYGQYIYTEGAEQIDYYFMNSGTILGNLELYDKLFK